MADTLQSRYEAAFAKAKAADRCLFIPFVTLGDPDAETSLSILKALLEAGADALELGIPFSDPIADGPVVERGSLRALDAGVHPQAALDLVRKLRETDSDTPIGLLCYANLVMAGGALREGPEGFYGRVHEAGVDSVLVADVPTLEAKAWSERAIAEGVCPVLIATPDLEDRDVAVLAELSRGYTYCVTRAGVTGADKAPELHHEALFKRLEAAGAPPPVLGFGISEPAHVKAAKASGAQGAISGSAVVAIIEKHLDDLDLMKSEIKAFVTRMREAAKAS